eukprot:scaffold15.g4228.t1
MCWSSGVAGLTAAALAEAQGVDVLVLEASNRAGGRLRSTPTRHGRVDLGAMWVRRAQRCNAIYDMAVEKGIRLSPRQDYLSVATYLPSGAPAPPALALSVLGKWAAGVTRRIAALRTPGSATPDVWESNALMLSNFMTLLNANATALSARRYGDAKTLPATDVMLEGGFDRLAELLLAELHNSTVLYNAGQSRCALVTAVEQDAGGVTVTTADGRVLRGRYALLTPSLGVLKAGAIAFSPPLPEAKAAAIAGLGFGLLDKLVLVFDAPFWDANKDFILRLPTDWSGRFSQVQSVRAWTAPDPVESYVTRWRQEPHILGSYSYFAVGNQKNITDVLAEPVGRILFGGEHTSAKLSTVLGAHLSGRREAESVLRLLGGEAA